MTPVATVPAVSTVSTVSAVFDVLIAAGGASRRMGTDKAALVVNGEALLDRTVQAARKAGARRVVVIGGATRPASGSARFIADSDPGAGPLSALIDGLRALHAEDADGTEAAAAIALAVFVAVDHPDLQPAEIAALADHLSMLPGHVLAVVPEVDGRSQPLHGAYRIALAEPLSEIYAAGERSLWRALATLDVDRPDRSSGRGRGSYRDLDNPEQLASYTAEHADHVGRKAQRSVADDDTQPVA